MPLPSWPKRLLRWQLRTLLVITTLLAMVLALYMKWVEPYRVQAHARKQLEAAGGSVQLAMARPAWRTALVGQKRYHRVVGYRAENTSITDEQLRPVAELPFLERLYLNKTEIGDDATRWIGQVGGLRRLSLWRTRISDEGVSSIARCRQLEVTRPA